MTIKKISLINFLFCILILTLSSCDDTTTNSDLDKKEIPSSNVSFSQHIYPVLNIKCNNAGCHDDQTRAGGISLTTWANIVADPTVVFPGEPQDSRLVWAIEGISSTPMPPVGYPTLTKNQIEGIKKWIEEGAKNN
ncbi:MAG: hypothetical protein STSR0008_04850 [Ignavibacterium sp.]